MENKYVWGNEELNNQLTAIAYAKNENEMAKAIRECLKNIAIEWWKDLSEETNRLSVWLTSIMLLSVP